MSDRRVLQMLPHQAMKRVLPVLSVIAILGYVISNIYRWWYWDFDDAYIVYRIVRNIVSGDGWSYNVGESHNASTSVLNTFVLALAGMTGGDIRSLAHTLEGVWIGGTALVCWLLYRERFGEGVGVIAALGVVRYLAHNATWGIETHLFLFLLFLFLLLEQRRRNSWFVIGLLILTRPDALLIAGLKWVRALQLTRRVPVRGPLQALLVLAPWVLYSLVNFRQVLPDTVASKIWQGHSGYWGTGQIYLHALWEHLAAPDETNFYEPRFSIVYYLAIPGVVAWLHERSTFLYLLAFAVLQQLAYVLLNIPGYHWYFAVLDGTASAAAAFTVGYAYRFLANLAPRDRRGALDEGTAFLALSVAAALAYGAVGEQPRDGRNEAYKNISAMIASKDLPPGPLATLEVGTLGFYIDDRPIVDLIGLASPNPEFVSGKNNDRFFERPPVVVLFHLPLWSFEQALFDDLRFRIMYDEAHSLPDPQEPMQYFVLNPAAKYLPADAIPEYIEQHYEPFVPVIPPFVEPLTPSPGFVCTLDLVNGQPVPDEVIHVPHSVLSVTGWAVNQDGSRVPERTSVLLISEEGCYSIQAERSQRPDGAEDLGGPEPEETGFSAEGSILELPAGEYRVGLLRGWRRNLVFCELTDRLVIND